jgi:hypothetical protein
MMRSLPMADSIRTGEREQDDAELRMLEELWAAPAAGEQGSPAGRAGAWLSDRVGWLLAGAWLAFVVSLFLAPAPDPELVVPLWAEALVAVFFLTLGTAGIIAALRTGRSAYVAATVAGIVGLGVSAACGATEHHPSGWWIYELAATGALTALAVTGLVRRR